MEQFKYKFAGIYDNEDQARDTYSALLQEGFSDDKQVQLLSPYDPKADVKLEPENTEIAKQALKGDLVGHAAGAGIGATGVAVMAAAEAALFVTHPVMATLMIVGYSSMIGALVGAAKGLRMKDSYFVLTVNEALENGYWAVAVLARDPQQQQQAQRIIDRSYTVSESSN